MFPKVKVLFMVSEMQLLGLGLWTHLAIDSPFLFHQKSHDFGTVIAIFTVPVTLCSLKENSLAKSYQTIMGCIVDRFFSHLNMFLCMNPVANLVEDATSIPGWISCMIIP